MCRGFAGRHGRSCPLRTRPRDCPWDRSESGGFWADEDRLGGRLPHRRRAVPHRHRRRRAASRADDPRQATVRARPPRRRPEAARLRAARPCGHVRLLRDRAGGRRRRPRRRLLPQRRLFDRLRPRDDRARHLGARVRRGRGGRAGDARRRRLPLRAPRDGRQRGGRRRSLRPLPERAVVRARARARSGGPHGRRRVRRRLLRLPSRARRPPRSCRG